MVHVRGDDHAAARDLAPDELGLEPLALGDVRHLLGDDAPPRVVHLRDARVFLALLDPGLSHVRALGGELDVIKNAGGFGLAVGRDGHSGRLALDRAEGGEPREVGVGRVDR